MLISNSMKIKTFYVVIYALLHTIRYSRHIAVHHLYMFFRVTLISWFKVKNCWQPNLRPWKLHSGTKSVHENIFKELFAKRLLKKKKMRRCRNLNQNPNTAAAPRK